MCSNRRRQRPQRYSDREFVDAISDNDEDFDSDDIVGEAVYDEEYLRQRKNRRKLTSSSEGEGDEEYRWSEENGEDEAEEEEDLLSNISDDSDRPSRRFRRPERGRTQRGPKLRSVGELQSGLRRSKRASRTRIDYRQYEFSDSDNESTKPRGENASDASGNAEDMMESQDSEGYDEDRQRGLVQPTPMAIEKDKSQPPHRLGAPNLDNLDPDPDPNGVGKRGFLDLNELAPGPSFEDGSNALVKDDDHVKGE